MSRGTAASRQAGGPGGAHRWRVLPGIRVGRVGRIVPPMPPYSFVEGCRGWGAAGGQQEAGVVGSRRRRHCQDDSMLSAHHSHGRCQLLFAGGVEAVVECGGVAAQASDSLRPHHWRPQPAGRHCQAADAARGAGQAAAAGQRVGQAACLHVSETAARLWEASKRGRVPRERWPGCGGKGGRNREQCGARVRGGAKRAAGPAVQCRRSSAAAPEPIHKHSAM